MTVKQIQHLLAYLGYYSGTVDGIWGKQSAAAATRFQQDYGDLSVDGLAGEQTQKALKQAVSAGMPENRVSLPAVSGARCGTRSRVVLRTAAI